MIILISPMISYGILAILSVLILAFLSMVSRDAILLRRMELQTLVADRDHTMKSLSSEIHDNMNQVLNFASMMLHQVEPADPDQREKLDTALELIKTTIRDMQYVSKALNNEQLLKKGFLLSVEQLAEWTTLSKHVDCRLAVTGKVFSIAPNEKLMLFRIVQEALQNALKYAKATTIRIGLDYQAGTLQVRIVDNGIGFDYPSVVHSSMGMRIMKLRASSIGGNLRIHSAPGAGTEIHATLKTQYKPAIT